MEAVLLTLALATCVESPSQCNYSEGVEGNSILVTACGLAPRKDGRPITIEGRANGQKYIVVLEPTCVRL